MRRFSVFVNWKTRYHKDVSFLQVDLKIPHNISKNPRSCEYVEIDNTISKFT